MIEQDLKLAHKHSSKHLDEVNKSKNCGCFYCLEIFPADDIDCYIDDGMTALCPHCMIDAVIGDAYCDLTKEFLEKMRHKWFGNEE